MIKEAQEQAKRSLANAYDARQELERLSDRLGRQKAESETLMHQKVPFRVAALLFLISHDRKSKWSHLRPSSRAKGTIQPSRGTCKL